MANGPADVANQWCREEFACIEFGDKRLNSRLVKIAEQLSMQPSEAMPQACGRWSDTKAAYRFFQNEKIQAGEIRRVHSLKTCERLKEFPVVLAATDKSYLNFDGHQAATGIGHIGSNTKQHSQGLIMHTALAVTPEGLPLGILDHEIWAREKTPKQQQKNKMREIPIEQKESRYWLQSLDRVSEMTAESGTTVVTVADREADIYEFMDYGNTLEAPFVVRAAWDRALLSDDKEPIGQLWQYMKKQKHVGTTKVDVPARGTKEPARVATVGIYFSHVNLRRPHRTRFRSDSVFTPDTPVYVVWASEVAPPRRVTPLEWMLFTNVPVVDFESAVERVNWYKQRWAVEVFHKILKSGCQVESCRLQTAERLERYITLFSVVAWRLHWMTHLNRQRPDLSCEEILEEHEWKSLYCKIHRTDKAPQKPPTTREAIRMIAQLGGFLARKGDKEPGVITFWRGWQRLADISEDWLLFRSSPQTCG